MRDKSSLLDLGRQGGTMSDDEAKLLREFIDGMNAGNRWSRIQSWCNQNVFHMETARVALARVKKNYKRKT